jgi:antitoxin (DNA-binding transcriptional repressor) of toxin-antitoxin stability system
VYNPLMVRRLVHISEAEAANDFPSLLERVRAGEEIIIHGNASPDVVIHEAPPQPRMISEAILIAKSHEDETGSAPVLDPDFAEDVEAVLNSRKPWNPPTWE